METPTNEKGSKENIEKTKKTKTKTVTDDWRVLHNIEEVLGRLCSKWSTSERW
jgi:hypothetical protein